LSAFANINPDAAPVAYFPATVEPIFLADWVDTDPPPRDWQVDGLVSRGVVTSLYGHGGSGKTMLAMDLMVETTAAIHYPYREWLGRAVKPGMTLGVFAEDDTHECVRRIKRMCEAKGLNLADHTASLQLVSLVGEDATLVTFPTEDREALTTPLFRRLEELIEEHFPSLLVLDYAAALFGGNELNRAQVAAFMRVLNSLAQRFDMAVLLLGHPSMEGLKNGRGFSGSTAWHNQSRAFLHLETVDEDADAEALPKVRVSVRKNNYGRSGDQITMTFDGSRFIVVDCPQGKKAKQGPRLTAAQSICLNALNKALDEAGEASPGGPIPNGVRVVLVDTWRRYAYAMGVSGSDDEASRRRAFFDTRQALQKKGLVQLMESFAWVA
jgi:RecA-family ATPase